MSSLGTTISATSSPSIFNSNIQSPIRLSSLAPLAIALAVSSSPLPSHAIPSSNSTNSLLPFSTPYTLSQSLKVGLENGKIRPCPSTNPGCISTNPKSSSFAFPWIISENSSDNAVKNLRDAIMKTQKNPRIQADEETPDGGHYLQAEVDGGFGRDVMEFLVKKDVVAYRAMASKVTYIYPLTTALGDSKGQVERLSKIQQELGWFAPDFESMN